MKQKNLENIKNNEDPAIKSIADDLDKITAISALNNMEGGKILVYGLIKDIVSNVHTLIASHKDLTLQEFVTLSAEMKTKLDLAKALINSDKKKEDLNELLEQSLSDE